MELLNNIKKVTAPDALWHKVNERVHKQQADIVPMHNVRAIAVAVALLFIANVVFAVQWTNTTDEVSLEEIIPEENYSLYE